jgi:hypothetical protein
MLKSYSHSDFNFHGHISNLNACVWEENKQKSANYLFVVTLLQEVLEITSMFKGTQLSSAWEENSETFEDSGRIPYFTSRSLN